MVKKNPLNLRSITIVALFVQLFVTTLAFLVFKASTFTEYANSFYIIVTAAFNVFTFPWNISKARNIFKLIDRLEAVIETSKFLIHRKIFRDQLTLLI